jgi:transcriptional regulator with XRE-family HTH domain
MFYQRLKKICDDRGITVTYLLKDLHISTSKGTAWKNGSSPNSEIVKKIANYFNVSTDYLLGNDDKKIIGSQKLVKSSLLYMYQIAQVFL